MRHMPAEPEVHIDCIFSAVLFQLERLMSSRGATAFCQSRHLKSLCKITMLPVYCLQFIIGLKKSNTKIKNIFMPPYPKMGGGVLFYHCPSVHPSVCLSAQT